MSRKVKYFMLPEVYNIGDLFDDIMLLKCEGDTADLGQGLTV